jgi:membrane-associated protease RseP (regulator of RpoE activity)
MGKIGIAVQNLNEDIATQFGYQESEGVLISNVTPGSPAAFAGLRPGMVIMEANRESVKNVSDLAKALNISNKSKKVLLLAKGPNGTRYVGFSIDLRNNSFAFVIQPSGTYGNDLAFLGFFFGGIGDDDPSGSFLFFFHSFYDNSVIQWFDLHVDSSK